MSLKILKQQLVDITQQETRKEKKTRKRLPLDDSFARKRKVMKKNLKPRGPKVNVQDSISQVKEGGAWRVSVTCRGAEREGEEGEKQGVEHEDH